MLYTLSMNEWNQILSKQFFLYSRCGTVCVGFFPWRNMVIMVILDAGCHEWALHIDENSRVELFTEPTARCKWKEWVEKHNYTTDHTGTGTLRTSCYGLAVRWRNEQEGSSEWDHDTQLNELLEKVRKQMIAYKTVTQSYTEYTNYNYPLEA